MTSGNIDQYGRLTPMLAAIEALVRCESPSEDLDACRSVVALASDIATRVLGTPAQIKEIEGRPVFWWGSSKPKVLVLAHLDTVWPHGSYSPLWEVNGDVVRGPGVFDMKAGFVQALFALKDIDGAADRAASPAGLGRHRALHPARRRRPHAGDLGRRGEHRPADAQRVRRHHLGQSQNGLGRHLQNRHEVDLLHRQRRQRQLDGRDRFHIRHRHGLRQHHDQHGWPRALDGQRLHRAALEEREIRGDLSVRTRHRARAASGSAEMVRPLQRLATP